MIKGGFRMKEFYMFDGEDFILCTEAIMNDLIRICEDNENMIIAIKEYFEDKGALGKWNAQ